MAALKLSGLYVALLPLSQFTPRTPFAPPERMEAAMGQGNARLQGTALAGHSRTKYNAKVAFEGSFKHYSKRWSSDRREIGWRQGDALSWSVSIVLQL